MIQTVRRWTARACLMLPVREESSLEWEASWRNHKERPESYRSSGLVQHGNQGKRFGTFSAVVEREQFSCARRGRAS